MVIKLTQKQNYFIKTFNGDKIKAIHYVSRWGFGYLLKNGHGKTYNTNREAPFGIGEKEMIIKALIDGYEVIVPKFKFHNFSNITGFEGLYYAGKNKQLTADYEKAKEVEKNSKEYVALENLGFLKDEV